MVANKNTTAAKAATPEAVSFEEWRLENSTRLTGLTPEAITYLYVKENVPEALPGARRALAARECLPVFPGPQKVIIESIIDFEKTDRYAVYVLVRGFIRGGALPSAFTEKQLLKACVGCGVPLTPTGYAAAARAKLLSRTSGTDGEENPDGRGHPVEFPERKVMVAAALEAGITSPAEIAGIIAGFLECLEEDLLLDGEGTAPPIITKKNAKLTTHMIRSDIRLLKRKQHTGLNWASIEKFKKYLTQRYD